jgi:hypothetical protein
MRKTLKMQNDKILFITEIIYESSLAMGMKDCCVVLNTDIP